MLMNGQALEFELANRASRESLWRCVCKTCLRLPCVGRNKTIAELEAVLDTRLPEGPTEDYAPMKWKEAQAADQTLVEYGSHTRTHTVFAACDEGALRYEVLSSKRILEARLDREIQPFCYPNGQLGDQDASTVAMIKNSGYRGAVVDHGGLVSGRSDAYGMSRFAVPNNVVDFRYVIDTGGGIFL
jgi:hypothetical protein